MDFNILIDDIFSLLTNDKDLSPVENKRVLSIINDFENGSWHSERFQKFIWNNIKETALSYKERAALINEGEDSVLTEAAKNLRLSEGVGDIGRGSEIAEILLYGIMKHHYKALPVVPKIFYKQNSQDNAKGADSVHIVVHDDTFSLWLGESKFYTSIDNARLPKIIESVKNSLSLDKLKKENAIITSLAEISHFAEISEDLRTRIVDSLSNKESIDKIKPILNIPILLLHECAITEKATHLTIEYREDVKKFHLERATEYFKRQIDECLSIDMYKEITFHIILFPVPKKEPIVEKFISKATVYRP